VDDVAAYISAPQGDRGHDLRYRLALWHPDSQRWIDRQIGYAGTHLYDAERFYAGGIAIDPRSPGSRVYISSNVDPATGAPLVGGRRQIFRGDSTNAGSAWRWLQLTDDRDADNIRPYVVPTHATDRTFVLWLRGQYRSYLDYAMQIVAIAEM
jgi:hypothetical protein